MRVSPDDLWSTEQRQERIRRNQERLQSLGLHRITQISPGAVNGVRQKPKRPVAKPKKPEPQRSYTLRSRAKEAADGLNQAQPSQVILLRLSHAW